MGKAVPRAIKIRAEDLIRLLPEKFSRDFEQNKRALDSLGLPFSKTDRNLIAGFISRKMAECQS
jgi:small subunit ribosomal protein S17e